MKFILETLVIIIALYLGVLAFFSIFASVGSILGVVSAISITQAAIIAKVVFVPSAVGGVLLSVFG